eukprot:gb/GEZN01006656.1/.p1 GENE.gb/GEZN01006656.1/~~gb/GEZN01006656.1/.p1  ORF type:complete len:325 (+),score=30.12 gb/GEZN01006656.1/:56-1030(+)
MAAAAVLPPADVTMGQDDLVQEALAAEDDLKRYNRLDKLGEGQYGVVYRAKDQQTGQIVAMKKIKLEAYDEGVPPTAIREISLLQELANHPNIVSLLNVIHQNTSLYLVFEFLDMDLAHYIKKQHQGGKKLKPNLLKSYMHQLVKGIAHCHRHRVFHRDLKPQNLLLDKAGTLKLGDFGLARAFNVPIRTYTHEVITLWYRAPEILLGVRQYEISVDMWSIACIFVEMATGRPLFPGDSEIDELFRIFRVLGTPTEELWPGVTKLKDFKATFPQWEPRPLSEIIEGSSMDEHGLDLLTKMFIYDPVKRISAREALKHPYFEGLQ